MESYLLSSIYFHSQDDTCKIKMMMMMMMMMMAANTYLILIMSIKVVF